MLLFFKKTGLIFFALGVVLSPASQLRFSGTSIGVGELFLILSILVGLIIFINRPRIKKSTWTTIRKNYIIFWIISLLIFIIGSIYAYLIGKLEIGSTLHNLSAYLFGFLILGTFLFFYSESDEKIGNKILTNITSFSGLLYLLYLLLIISGKSSFANCDLYFELRFTGFGLNPNQLAFTCVPIPFLAISIYRKPNQANWMKIWMVIVFIATITVGILTLSDALIVSWVVGSGLLYYVTLLRGIFKKHIKVILSTLFISITLIGVCIYFLNKISEYVQDTTYGDGVSNDQGSIRLLLWKNALYAFSYSPIFGLGPGSYSGYGPFQGEEAHNSFIDWMVSTGLIGFLILFYLMFKKFQISWRKHQNEYISILVAIYTFSMFHLILRHIFFWTFIIFL